MRHTLKMPKLGDTAGEVLVLAWLVSPSERVEVGQPMLTVETDKVEIEVPCPVAGILVQRLVEVDQEVAVGSPIAIVEAS